jgi:hypothetical protein
MTVLDGPNRNPTGKWGWWGDPNVTDEMIVDYEMRNKRYGSVPIDPLPGQTGSRMPTIFGGMGPRIDERYGYIPGADPRNAEMVLRYPQTRLPGQTGFGFGDGFALETDPFGGGMVGNLAGKYGLWGGLGGLVGAGLGKIFSKK